MPAFSTIKVGDRLWDVHSERMGNTTMRRMGSWPVDVIEVDPERRRAKCVWNHNVSRASWYTERQLARLRRTPYKKKET